MTEIFRIVHPNLGYSTGGCPPKFTWIEGYSKMWTRRGDVVRHLKMLDRAGYADIVDTINVQHAIFEPRSSVVARAFLNEFEDLREKRRIERETRRKARGILRGELPINATKHAESLKDPVKSALEAILKSV